MEAFAVIVGNDTHQQLAGMAHFHEIPYGGVVVHVKIHGLQLKISSESQLSFIICVMISVHPYYGTKRLISLGNKVAYLTFSCSNNLLVNRSSPSPRPPWGGIPY